MSKHSFSYLAQNLCVGIFLIFVFITINYEAKASPRIPNHGQSAAPPSLPNQNLNSTTTMPSNPTGPLNSSNDTKIGTVEATSIIKQAIDTQNETVKEIEAFYNSTVDIFLRTITILAVLAGLVGSVAIGHIVKTTAKTQAREIFSPYERQAVELYGNFKTNSERVISDYKLIRDEHAGIKAELRKEREDYTQLRNEFDIFKKKAQADLGGLRAAMLAWSHIVMYMQNIKAATSDEERVRLKSLREQAKLWVEETLVKIKPSDELVLSLTYSVHGIILFFDDDFEAGLNALRQAITYNNENMSAHFNCACCACRLASKIEEAPNQAGPVISELENEALASLVCTLKYQPWRKAEIINEAQNENGDLRRLREHPQFKRMVS